MARHKSHRRRVVVREKKPVADNIAVAAPNSFDQKDDPVDLNVHVLFCCGSNLNFHSVACADVDAWHCIPSSSAQPAQKTPTPPVASKIPALARSQHASAPWVAFFRKHSGWSKEISAACNPNYGNCACLQWWHNKSVCKDSKPDVVIRVNRQSHLFNGQEFAFGMHQCKSTKCFVTDKQIEDYNAFLIGFPVEPSESAFPRKSFKNQINAVVTIENPIYRYSFSMCCCVYIFSCFLQRPNMFEEGCRDLQCSMKRYLAYTCMPTYSSAHS